MVAAVMLEEAGTLVTTTNLLSQFTCFARIRTLATNVDAPEGVHWTGCVASVSVW